jgi:hypothetical protein
VVWGRNINNAVSYDDFLHEYFHYYQQNMYGFAAFQGIGIYEQLRDLLNGYGGWDPYFTPGTQEWWAEQMMNKWH